MRFLLLVVRGLVPRDAEGMLLLMFVRHLGSRKGVLLFLFCDGVAGVEAEEAAADLHEAALPFVSATAVRR